MGFSTPSAGIACGASPPQQREATQKPNPTGYWIGCRGEKKLVVYSMLLAQFLGTVHEIKPQFLNGPLSLDPSHLPPILIALGHFSATATAIVSAYPSRGIRVTISENYDIRLAQVWGSFTTASPFL